MEEEQPAWRGGTTEEGKLRVWHEGIAVPEIEAKYLGGVPKYYQPKIGVSNPPFPPLSANIRNWPAPPPPLVRKYKKWANSCQQ